MHIQLCNQHNFQTLGVCVLHSNAFKQSNFDTLQAFASDHRSDTCYLCGTVIPSSSSTHGISSFGCLPSRLSWFGLRSPENVGVVVRVDVSRCSFQGSRGASRGASRSPKDFSDKAYRAPSLPPCQGSGASATLSSFWIQTAK